MVGCDFSEPMLELARRKAARRGLKVDFGWADALELPYEDASFDAVTVGFGARNLADLDRGLAEMARVLRPGGRLVILEITQPRRPPLVASTRSGSTAWFRCSGRSPATRTPTATCPSRCAASPSPRRSRRGWTAAGLERIRWLLLAGGIIAIHSGDHAPA